TVELRDDTVVYTPARGYTGPAQFTYTVGDGRGGTATGVVDVTVDPAPPTQPAAPALVFARGTLDGRRRGFTLLVTSRPAADRGLLLSGGLTFLDPARRLALRSTEIELLGVSDDGRRVTVAGDARANGVSGYT